MGGLGRKFLHKLPDIEILRNLESPFILWIQIDIYFLASTIYWDQASVLVQIGALDPKDLPVAGIATADKMLDESRPSNTLMQRWAASAPAEAAE